MQLLDKKMAVIARKIMEHYRKKLWLPIVVFITTIMSCSSEFTTKVTMISNFSILIIKLDTTDMTLICFTEHLSFNFSVYYLLFKLKLVINLLNIAFKSINKNLCNIIIFTFGCEYYWLLRINAIIKTFNIIAKRARSMFLIFISVGFTTIRSARANWLNK